MGSKVLSEKEWVTLKEASKITGRSVHAFRQLINRKRIDKIKKMKDNGPGYWVIHRDHLSEMEGEMLPSHDTSQGTISDTSQVVTIPAEVYERQQKEHDNMLQGLMMYRYKFEEMERQMRLLPAPVEIIPLKLSELEAKTSELEEKTAALSVAEDIIQQAQETQRQYEKAMEQLKLKLQEEEHAKEAFRIQWELSQAELKRPWWQRLWRK